MQHTLQVSASLVSLRTCTESVPQRSSRFTRLNSRKLFSSVVASWQLRCSTHCMYVVPASASASCRQAAASLLHQMEPHGGDFGAAHIAGVCVRHLRVVPSSSRKVLSSGGASWRLRCSTQSVQVLGRGSKHSHAECKRQRRARTLRPPPPCTVQHPQACSISESVMAAPLQTIGSRPVEQPQACSISRSVHGGCIAKANTRAGAWLESRKQRRARTLSLLSPRTVEQPQACSISRSVHGGCNAKANTAAGGWLECRRQRRAHTLSPPPPRTVEQSQACSISWRSMAASVAEGNHLHMRGHGQALSTTREPAAEDEHAP